MDYEALVIGTRAADIAGYASQYRLNSISEGMHKGSIGNEPGRFGSIALGIGVIEAGNGSGTLLQDAPHLTTSIFECFSHHETAVECNSTTIRYAVDIITADDRIKRE